MKALVKKKATTGLWMEDVPIPKIAEDEVLIKTRKTSICGTDVHIYKWDAWAQKTIPVPMVVGHEFMGEIVEVGKACKKFKSRRSRLRRRAYNMRTIAETATR